MGKELRESRLLAPSGRARVFTQFHAIPYPQIYTSLLAYNLCCILVRLWGDESCLHGSSRISVRLNISCCWCIFFSFSETSLTLSLTRSLTHLSVRQLPSQTFPSFSFPRGNFSPNLSANVSICRTAAAVPLVR